MKRWIIAVVLVAAVLAGILGYRKFNNKVAPNGSYRTARVERGDVVQTVRASGTIQPVKLVQVGTQVNGPIKKLYVDYNTPVKAGDLVAQIDATTFEARVAQDRASLIQSQANVEQVRAKLVQAEKELERAKKLTAREMLSQAELDTSVAAHATLVAQLKVAEAEISQAEAVLQQSMANLGYTTIRSPVDGVVIARNVSEGQTVVASMNAQMLFLIAGDLGKIQVEASVPEADIGSIAAGQVVTFTVDAYEQTFTGAVVQIRMAASTVQNVVTYPVIVEAPNPGNKLFPSMTADIICEVAHHAGVLKVPNAALRFKPEKRPSDEAGTEKKGAARGPRGPRIWISKADGSGLSPVAVSPGITDGAFTEIREPATLAVGDEVVIGLQTAENNEKTVNPFTPQMPARRTGR
jgi:HlyD family secretion protein